MLPIGLKSVIFKTLNYVKLTMCLLGLAIVAILFLDKPSSLWLHENLQHSGIQASSLKGASWLYDTVTSELSLILFVVVVLIFVVLDRREFSSKKQLLALIVYQIFCLLCLNYIKSLLKYFFGRCVPDVCFLPWYIDQSNQYGFAWFSKVSGFASFPSGHCTFMSFCLFWVIALRSRLKVMIGSLFGLLFGGLVLFNYHFLGDCLAGSALGIFSAGCSYWLWCRALQPNGFNVNL